MGGARDLYAGAAGSLEYLWLYFRWIRFYAAYLRWLARERPVRQSGRLTSGDAELFYRVYGEGEPVLLLHGGFMAAEAWAAQIPVLAGRYRVAALDTRGHGRSTLGGQPLTYLLLAEDAAAAIRELGMAPAHVIGWSDGGTAALALAMREPGLVRSLVLLGTPYNLENYSQETLRRMDSFLSPRSPEMLALRALRALMNPERGSWSDFASRMSRMWRELPDFTAEELGSIEAPTLVVACDRDEFLSAWEDPLRVFRETARAIPRSSMVEVRGGGHTLLVQKPRELNRILMDYLASA